MIGVIFLSVLALIWIVFAVIQDLRSHEVSNWLNFSLIVFALGFRFFYSLFSDSGFSFFYQGAIGLAIFFAVGNLLYYGKLFAGGDAKLMIALGAVLPLTTSLASNIKIFIFFLLLFFFSGAIYTIITSAALGIKNSKKLEKEFTKQFAKNKSKLTLTISFSVILAVAGFFIDPLLIYLSIMIFILPYIYIYAKAVDEACMIKSVPTKDLVEGDWLYKSVKTKGKTIKADWDGLTHEDISRLKKSHRKVRIREGVPFTPVFLISFVLMLLLYNWALAWNFFL